MGGLKDPEREVESIRKKVHSIVEGRSAPLC